MTKFNRFKLISIFLLLGIISCSIPSNSEAPEVMYFILIDRFVDGDSSNNAGHNPESYLPYDGTNPEALKYYQGGDLLGITQNLDNLKAMGMTMIWISPFLDNSNTDYVGWWPYHGYHPIDFYGVDEHFGSLEDLKLLVATAHAKGLKVIFDMPFNQTAADHPWIGDASKKNWFHWDEHGQPYQITDWFNQEQIERGELHGLPDLAQENPAVSEYIYEVSKYWIEETGCDGFRLDAVKHIPLSFWIDYNFRIKELAGPEFLLFGEVFWGEAERIKPYADVGFDLLFDLPGYYAINNTFNKGGSIKDFSRFYETTSNELGSSAMATLIDNHDVARFNVDLGDLAWEKQLLALGWLVTAPGLPVIYYGTEFGMPGYPPKSRSGEPQDYLNRLPYPLSPDENEQHRQDQFIQLVDLRHQYSALTSGSFNEIYKDWSIYAYSRSLENEHLLIVLNTASTAEFLSIPKLPGITIRKTNPAYGPGVLREEDGEFWLRLPANSVTVWEFERSDNANKPVRVAFTNRFSSDFQNIRLYYLDPQASVRQLQLAGDFNNWTPAQYTDFRRADTVFIDIPLKPGVYNYKFVLNGTEWLADPNATDFSTDPYGGRNSILRVIAD